MKYTIKVLAAMAVIATAISCSEKSEWTPGPDVAPGCMGVYFEPLSSNEILVAADDSKLLPFTVGRAVTDDAATVEFIVNSCPEGAVVPSSVSFEAGQQTATCYIDVEDMPSKTSGTVSLAIPEKMLSPYAAGVSELSLKIDIAGQWLTFAKDAKVSFSSVFPGMTTDILMLDGTNNFKINNFLGSGIDFTFSFGEPGENGGYPFIPVSNYVDVHDRWGADYEYNGWFIYDYENNGYAAWAIDDESPYIYDMEFDGDYSNGYFSDKYLYFYTYTTYDGGATFIEIWIEFEPEFDPFGTEGE